MLSRRIRCYLLIVLSSQMQQQELRGADSWRRADMWCLGCTVLEMLNGTADASTDDDLSHSSSLLQFSTACSEFVQLCMQTEPTDRPSALQLLQHSFVAAPSTCSSSYGSGSYGCGSYTDDSPQRLARHSFDSPGSGSDAALRVSSDDSKLQQHYSNNNCSNSNNNSKSSSSCRAPASDLQVPSPVIHYSAAVPARRHCWTDASSVADAITAAAAANTRSSPGSAFASGSSDECAAERSVPVDTSVAPLTRATAEQQYASTRLLRPRALSLPRLLSTSNTLHTGEALLLSSSAHATASGLATQASNSSSSTSSAATGRTQSLPSLLFKRRVHTVSTSPVSVASGLASPDDDDDDSSTTAAAVALDCSEKLHESVGRVRARRHSAPTASMTSSSTSPQWWLHQSDAAVEAPCSTHTAVQQQQQQQQHLSNSHPNSAAIAAVAAAIAGAQHDAHQQQRRRTSWTAGTVHSGTTSTRTSYSALLSSSMTSRSAQASPDARHNGWSVTVKRGGLPPPIPLNTSNTLANTSLLLSASASGSVKRLVSPRTLVQAQHTSSSNGNSSGKRGRSPSHDSSMPVLLRATHPAAKMPARGSSVSACATAAVKAIDSSSTGISCGRVDGSRDSSTRTVMNRSRSVDELTRALPRQLASSSSFSSSSSSAADSYSHASMTAAIAQSWLTAARTSLAVRLQRRLDRGLPVSDECLAWLSDEHEQHHTLQLQRCEQRHLQASAAAAGTAAASATAQRGRKQRRTWSPDDELELSTVSSSMDYRRTHSSGRCNSASSAATTTCGGAVATSMSCDADLMLLEEGLLPLHNDSVHSIQLQQQQQLCANSSSDPHSESIHQHQQQQQQQQQHDDDDAIECLSVSSCASVSDGADAVHSDSNSVSNSSCSSSSSVCCDGAAVPEVRAVADYQGDDSSELSFKAGDIIEVLQETDSGWWLGILVEHATPADDSARSTACDVSSGTASAVVQSTSSTAIGKQGFFPCTFVEWLES
jgi:SH3 domain